MIRHLWLVALIIVAGCSSPTSTPQSTPSASPTPVAQPTPIASPSPSGFAPVTDLPRGLIGTWTADKAGRCTPGTELRIVVEPRRVRFYESEARITRVTQVDPHSWGIDADMTGEGETRRVGFDLNLNEDGSLTRVEAPFPDITYIRCKAAS